MSVWDNDYYLDIISKYWLKVMSLVSNKFNELWLDYELISNDYNALYNPVINSSPISIFLKKYKWWDIINIEIFLISVLLLFIDTSRLQVKEITSPHITYWLQFFQVYPEYNYLSFVLYHHATYPSKEEILYYEGDRWLNKYKNLLWIDNNYIDGIDSNEAIRSDDKDYLMVLLTTCDLVDALLSWRKYQKNFNFKKLTVLNTLSPEFRYEIDKLFKSEDNSTQETIFNRIVAILDKEFENNSNYVSFIRLQLLTNKSAILSMYSNK